MDAGRLVNPQRLTAVRETGLLDTPAEAVFDDLAQLAAQMTGMPLSFITFVDGQRSYWKATIGTGIAPDDTVSRQNSVQESFCQYLITTDGPVVVTDAASDELTWDNPSVEKMGVRAWAGYPVRSPDGSVLGSFCVVDTQPHQFSDVDLRVLSTLAAVASREVALRVALHRASELAGQGEDANRRLLQQARASEELGASLAAVDVLTALSRLVVPELGSGLAVALLDEAAAVAIGHVATGDPGRVVIVEVAHADPERQQILATTLSGFPLSTQDSHGVGRVIATSEVEYIADLKVAELRFAQAPDRAEELLEAAAVESALTVPLVSRGRALGAMTVTAPASTPMDHVLIADLGRRAGTALDNAIAYGAQQRVGADLQRSLMPGKPPTLPGVTLATRYLPATTGALAGGDFHHVVRRPHDLVLVLGDVEGHGMTSAARMGQLRAAVAALALEGHAPSALLERLAADTAQILDISLATLLIAAFDPTTRTLVTASAGHPPPVVVEPGAAAVLLDLNPGPPLGTGPGRYPQQRCTLQPRSTVVLYSDGLVERRDEDIDVGLERLRVALDQAGDVRNVQEIADRVLDRTGCSFGGDDDIALLVLRC